jgi:hypothetical protein
VGTNYFYRRFKVKEVAYESGAFTGEYFHSPPPGSYDFYANFLKGIWDNGYWQVDRSGLGTPSAKLVLPYLDRGGSSAWISEGGGSTNPAVLPVGTNPVIVAQKKADYWDQTGTINTFSTLGPEPEQRNPDDFGDISSLEITSFSPFTFGFTFHSLLILPIQLLSFEASLQPDNSSLLTWQIADDRDLRQFEVEVSRDGQRFTKLTTMGRNGTQYTYRHTGLQSGVYYYRLHILGKDGSRAYSKVQMVQVGVQVTVIQGLLQNPVQGGKALIKVYSATPQDAFATVVDHAGRVLLRQKIALSKGSNLAPLSVLPLLQGMYRLHLQTADGVQHTMPFVK